MTNEFFHKGVATIQAAIEVMLEERAVTGGVVKHDARGAEPHDTEFSLSVGGKTETTTFARQEIEDSALAIDAPSATKVRMLVGPFVGKDLGAS